MKFRIWFENNGGPFFKGMPYKAPDFNAQAVNKFVEAMANTEKNASAVYTSLLRRNVNEERYNQPIAENLLFRKDERLGNATGRIAGVNESKFAFKDGIIKIIHPPIIYEEQDKHLLFGIITHELTHAVQWLENPKYKPAKFNGFDFEKYASHWTECHAFAVQLIILLNRIRDKKMVLDMLGKGGKFSNVKDPEGRDISYLNMPVFSFSPVLLDFAKQFLYHYQGKNMIGEDTAMVRQDVQPEVHQAVDLVQKIINKMLFRNFVMVA